MVRVRRDLAAHSGLVEKCLDSITDRLGELLPGFGSSVAVDATTVRTHSNPDKRVISDPEASWTAKKGTQGKKIWHFGYKLHLVADSTNEQPVGFTVTTAKRQDTQEFIPALERSVLRHGWFRPNVVSADADYDADANYKLAKVIGASPVIKAKSLRKNFGVDDPRLPRTSQRWREVYSDRQAVERCFSRLKGHRTLNDHCRRGLAKVGLHIAMSLLALQASALVAAVAGEFQNVAACTRRVA